MPTPIAVIIPAYNEEAAIGKVLEAVPWSLVEQVIVVDNGSTDATAARAVQMGANLVREPRRGYGQACLSGIGVIKNIEIVVFLDGDYSDYPEEMEALTAPIVQGRADLVIGSRTLGEREKGALLPQARFGNALATRLIHWLFRVKYTDLGPFRAIRFETLKRLQMQDRNFGWTVEMQVKAARLGVQVVEVPVRYRRRIGTSKISGTLSGAIRAGYKILWTIFRYARYREGGI
ncbi:MAG: UDP-glucose--dolichyl-phosphate glucosyltransferase [Gemmatimonadetes bacterium]|nr:UDP-glucose--dolichyl-phosphate glucosyltransferase [Gemmatimonadota bacterium]